MKNLLFISIAFPPKNDPECLQTAKYFRYLEKNGNLKIEVLTSASPTLYMPYDKNLEHYCDGLENLIELKITENKYLNFLKRKFLPGYFEKPDSKSAFHLNWKKVLNKIKEKPDIIYSRSFPISSTLMALKMKEYFSVPWVLHLSDPWAFCPITLYKSKKEQAYHHEQEKKCIEKASLVCLTSEKTVELYRSVYPEFANKFLLFPNVYDPQDFKPNEFQFSDKINIVYTGGLVEKRSVSYIIDALKILEAKNPLAAARFEFTFAGAMDSFNKSFFEKSTFANLRHLGLLPYNEALELQRKADILLVIDNPIDNPDKAVFFPSKLLDYMLMQRNILAVTTPGGSTDKIIKKMDAISFSHSDQDGLVAALLSIFEAYESRNESFFYKKSIDDSYSADYNAKRLLQTFESLLK
jgi:glycosyltransferase involved in cell wall biosynthesis